MRHFLVDALTHYGYVAIFCFVGIESVGVPLPGEASLILGAIFAASGHLAIAGVILSAAAGGIVGSMGGYWIGHSGGVALVERYGRVFGFTPARAQSMQRFFTRYGAVTVFFARFVTVLRAWAFILAGTAKMPLFSFTLFNVLGAIVWATAYGVLGYVFGDRLLPIAHHFSRGALIVLVLIAVGALGYSTFKRHAKRTTSS